jgi:hypothetical protein
MGYFRYKLTYMVSTDRNIKNSYGYNIFYFPVYITLCCVETNIRFGYFVPNFLYIAFGPGVWYFRPGRTPSYKILRTNKKHSQISVLSFKLVHQYVYVYFLLMYSPVLYNRPIWPTHVTTSICRVTVCGSWHCWQCPKCILNKIRCYCVWVLNQTWKRSRCVNNRTRKSNCVTICWFDHKI